MQFKIDKIINKLWYYIVIKNRKRFFYSYFYKSYWHSLLFPKVFKETENFYFSAVPNHGAGIGHQMANWIAGYWFSKLFKIQFAHTSFKSQSWEDFLAFGEREVNVIHLLSIGYKKIRLPLFDEDNLSHIKKIERIIKSYSGKKIVFVCEQDQFYKRQYDVIEDLQEKFYSSKARKQDVILYDKNKTSVGVHIRRGDIISSKATNNPNLIMRFQEAEYFYNVLKNVLKIIPNNKEYEIFLFSQGKKEDFNEFLDFDNIHFCFDMNAQETFLHMVSADYLITSKSSFSYKPALLNKSIKICPSDFWHSYPNTADWILVDEDGNFKYF